MNKDISYNYQGKVALITGAATGIGLAAARAFANAGASLVLAGNHLESIQKVAQALEKTGAQVLAIACDVAVEEQVKNMMDKTEEAFGRLDFAYNNAGVMSRNTETSDLTTDEWERVMNVNLSGIRHCMKYQLIQMKKQGDGAIINCSSMGGLKGAKGLSAYAASKFGVIGLTRSAALEYASQGIRINAVCPGFVHTPMEKTVSGGSDEVLKEMATMVPANRFCEPEEIADAVLWLCSSGATMVIGQALAVDGGITA
ncbi:MAG: SDR family oxidoreductase [Bacteroidetes bacterium]|nr:SDR family oxidoreductase [Bacteroidota bacterium]